MTRSLRAALALAMVPLCASMALAQTSGQTPGSLAGAPPAVQHSSGPAVTDSGQVLAPRNAAPTATVAGGQLNAGGPDSLTTLFAGNNSFAGNMFDIHPTVNLRLRGIEINVDNPGVLVGIDVYYRQGSSFGNESSPAGWLPLGSGFAVSQGTDVPTFVPLTLQPVIFKAGRPYGLYVAINNYDGSFNLQYTNGGPNVYANEDLLLETNCGNGDPQFTGGVFFPRQWNGTLYYVTIPTLNVALLGSESTTAYLTDAQSKLEATGKFNAVDLVDVRTSTPALADLLRYDSLMVWSDAPFFDATALGNTLADYVDAGGGVVVTMFGHVNFSPTHNLQGRWVADGYEILTGTGFTTGVAGLGAVALPGHPLMTGVTSLVGGSSSYRPTSTTLTAGSSLIASWNDGKILAAEGRPGRIDLGLWPVSSDVRPDNWLVGSDGDVLMANALHVAANRKPRVLIAAAVPNPVYATDVQAKLMASDKFSVVDLFDTSAGTPTLPQLRSYAAVLSFTDAGPLDSVALGDVLADYVDAGGGVVSAMFETGSIPILGRWSTGGYEVLLGVSQQSGGGPFTLGTVNLPGHPVMNGVSSFSGGTSSYRPVSSTLATGAVSIAEWSDGIILAAQGVNRQRVDLGFYPPSSDARADFWDATTDGAKLMCNSLLHVSQRRPRVLVAASDGTANRDDVAAKLRGTGDFATVDIFVASAGTPTLAQLRAYDGVLLYTNSTLFDPIAMGDVLADYVDAGGGVFSVFGAQVSGNFSPAGRWATGGYELLVVTSFQSGVPATLGVVNEPLHPVMQGVATFDGGPSSFRLTSTTLQPGARSICDWTDGTALIVGGSSSRRLDMNAFAFSSDASAAGWVSSSDGARLMANALLFVSRGVGGAVGTTYCTAGTTFDGCHATISASGKPSVSKAAGFLIDVTNMPGNKNGILFYGLSGPNSAPWGNSTSFLCVKAPTQRMGLLSSGGAPGTCDGVFQLDWLDYVATHPNKLGVPFAPGCGVWAQAWFRDPAAGTGPVGAKGTATSNGLFFVTQP